MRTLSLFMAGLGLCAAAHGADAGRLNHFDPASLNDYAVRKYQEGDRATARLLLERAHLLAPQDAAIARNLRIARGEEAPEGLKGQRDTTPTASSPQEREKTEEVLPPLWPR
ncbi:hypothetical protein SAMN06265795_10762 [Noviherbaspirillum humi]|uniref:Tetratricopeptide repeat-containing protein n=1 Tax=Noviherbaspirillum humi TaxID=1688639 RepID=A0A239HND0_9BURK|nr:hypothetical protein [Noviherbaspirillum humi]SNS82403.1 hypothetical protein SAMN06265795_10762 [Noviherbaspirillum humi]